jgi:small subunit ribosomal protein S8
MMMNDPIGDLLTRIRNGHRASKKTVKSPASNLRKALLTVLEKEGYIRGFSEQPVRTGISELTVELKYLEGVPVIHEINRISKPGRRVYTSYKKIPVFHNNLGINILSTPQGVMSDYEARQLKVGGEILCQIF